MRLQGLLVGIANVVFVIVEQNHKLTCSNTISSEWQALKFQASTNLIDRVVELLNGR